MLTWILFAGAVVCLLYFAVIVIYSGLTSTGALIWLIFAVFLLVTASVLTRYLKDHDSVPLRLPVTLITLCGAGLVIILILGILIFYRIPAVAEPDLDYVIVLGSSVRDDRPGKVLTKRLDKAFEYVSQNPSARLILSGGKDGFDSRAEAWVMRDYLLEKGVPDTSMIIEDKSLNTRENILYSRLKIEKEDPRIGILTSNFHLYRAMHIAKKQGIEGACGIAAPCDRVLLIHLSVRDALAILKDRLLGNL